MGSPHTDVLMLKGVAAIVRDLVEFAPVHELFQNHLQRWRKKYCLFEKQRVKVKAQLAEFWRDEPQSLDPYQEKYWPARRIYSPDRTKSDLFPIPPKLDLRLRRYEGPIRHHSLRSLHEEQNLTVAESFILLAELYDAAYSQLQLGEEKEFMVGVAEATEILAIGLPQAAVVNLKTLFQRVLDQIEALADSRSRNKSGKTLQEIMIRSRETLADLVIRSRAHLGTESDQKSVHDAIEASQSKLLAAIEAQGRSQQTESLVSADQLGAFARVGGKVIRNALRNAGCKPWIKSTGKGNPHWWRYCDAVEALQTVQSGKLRSFKWPESAADVMPQKDSSKIPARK